MQRVSGIEVKVSGIEALNKALGAADAYRFMALLHIDRTDYVDMSRRLYDGQSLDEIYSRAKSQWGA
ncbi:MAG TPA: hypothetical protein PKM65_19575 [Spirochaetota bacterium]|nr:hypothetical protein [Spirochaetota bacterium]HNT12969.1 hypothetical protein [Spirochaetota bacterium]